MATGYLNKQFSSTMLGWCLNTAWLVADTAFGCTPLAGPYRWMFHGSKTSSDAPLERLPAPEVTHSKYPLPSVPARGRDANPLPHVADAVRLVMRGSPPPRAAA